jgi:hypothetical protein
MSPRGRSATKRTGRSPIGYVAGTFANCPHREFCAAHCAQVGMKLRWLAPAFFYVQKYNRSRSEPFFIRAPDRLSRVLDPFFFRARLEMRTAEHGNGAGHRG